MRWFTGVCLSVCLFTLVGSAVSAQTDRLAKSIRLVNKEKSALDTSLPRRVREFLETADQFEVFAQLEVIDGVLQPAMGRELVPNFKAAVTEIETRNRLLKALYTEASKDEGPAICYLPSHSLVARKGDQKIKVEICFGCNRFYVSGSLGESEGTFSRRSGETERLISKLISDSGVTTK